jgi:hypothetical protein
MAHWTKTYASFVPQYMLWQKKISFFMSIYDINQTRKKSLPAQDMPKKIKKCYTVTPWKHNNQPTRKRKDKPSYNTWARNEIKPPKVVVKIEPIIFRLKPLKWWCLNFSPKEWSCSSLCWKKYNYFSSWIFV